MAVLSKGTLIHERFEIQGHIGGGGFGDVWHGYDRTLEREIAIKRLSSRSGLPPKEEVIDEARKVASLTHPNIVSIYDVSEYQGEWLIVMEYLSGGSLQDYLRDLSRMGRWVEPPESFELLRGILAGLQCAHSSDKGCIIHKDLKPLNILLDRKHIPKIVDFGWHLSERLTKSKLLILGSGSTKALLDINHLNN